MIHFANRQEAGKELAEKLKLYKDNQDVVIYALPRGGVVLGTEIAKILHVPLDLIITRKIGHPYNPEYAICAVAENGEMICNELERALVDQSWLEEEIQKETGEAKRRREVYLKGKPGVSSENKTAILVDDGIATGLTLEVAIQSLKKQHAKKVIVAIPVAPHDAVMRFEKQADKIIVLEDDINYLGAVGAYYEDFPQVSDNEVIELLNKTKAN